MLGAVKVKYPETKQFVDDTMEEECQKEKISANEVIFLSLLIFLFFLKPRSKELAQRNIFCFAVRTYLGILKNQSEI